MATYNIGRIRPNKRGDWDSSLTYQNFDAVRYQDQWWIANKDVPANTVPVEGEYWSLFGIKGDTQRPDNETLELNKDGLMAIKPEIITDIYDKVCDPINVKDSIVETHPVESYPVKVKSFLEPWQEGEGDPSPSNVRPVHGWNSANVIHCSNNLLDIEWVSAVACEFATTNIYGTSIREENGSYIISQSTTEKPDYPDAYQNGYIIIRSKDTPLYKGEYFLEFDLKIINNPLEVTRCGIGNNTVYKPKSFAVQSTNDWQHIKTSLNRVSEDKKYCKIFEIELRNCGVSCEIKNISLSISKFSSYEPYHGQTLTQALPEEVFGGEYDWETGVLTVTAEKMILTSDNTWRIHDYKESLSFTTNLKRITNTRPLYARCDKYKFEDAAWSYKDHFGGFAVSYNEVYFQRPNAEVLFDLEQWSNWLNTNGPLTIVYSLYAAKHYTIQLQPHLPPSAFKGTNIFYSNCGQTEITAREDPVYSREQLRNAILALGGKF